MSTSTEPAPSIGMLLDVPAAVFPDEVAVAGQTASVTYAQLRAHAMAWAAWLSASVNRDACVAYIGPLTPRFVALLFGCAYASIPLMPVNYRLTGTETARLLRRATATTVLVDERNEAKVAGALDGQAQTRLVTGDWAPPGDAVPTGDSMPPGDSMPTGDRVPADASADGAAVTADRANPAAIFLPTSGTTSEPKIVTITHRNLMHYISSTVDAVSAQRDESALLAVPPYHIAAIAQLLSNVFRARRALLQERFDPVEWLQTVRREHVTHAMVVPTMLARIVEAVEADPVLRPQGLQTLTYGGARAPAGLVAKAIGALPEVGFVNAFGLTEASSTVCVLTPADHRAAMDSGDESVRRRLDSVGRPVPGVEVSIQAEDGTVLGPGAVGEICIRGGQVVTGYLGAKAAIDSDGWLHTSDLGYTDDGGYLFVKGRQDDVIIRGGENIDPAEIEDTIAQHPAIEDTAVVGLPDPDWGEVVGVLAVLRPDQRLDLDSLRAWLHGRLASYKIPAALEVVGELPRNDLGKLVRRRAAQYFATADQEPADHQKATADKGRSG